MNRTTSFYYCWYFISLICIKFIFSLNINSIMIYKFTLKLNWTIFFVKHARHSISLWWTVKYDTQMHITMQSSEILINALSIPWIFNVILNICMNIPSILLSLALDDGWFYVISTILTDFPSIMWSDFGMFGHIFIS